MVVHPLEFPNVRCILDRCVSKSLCGDRTPQQVSIKSHTFQAYTQGLLESLKILEKKQRDLYEHAFLE